MTPETRTRQIVRGYFDARFRGDVPAAVAHLAEPFTFQSPLMSATWPGSRLPPGSHRRPAGWERVTLAAGVEALPVTVQG